MTRDPKPLQARRGWMPQALATLLLLAATALPNPARSASASAFVHNVGVPFQSVFDGFGGTAPQAQVTLIGGGELLPWREGQGSFILAANARNADGGLHASVHVGTVGRGNTSAGAAATVVDTLVIGGTRPVELELRLAVQGSFFVNGRDANFNVSSGLSVGDFSSETRMSWFDGSAVANPMRNVAFSPANGERRVVSSDPANTIVWLTVRQMVDPGSSLDVSAFLSVNATATENSEARANFDHTAQLWLGLPAGTPFTSRSGVFLTEAPLLPVPEPGTAALALAGGLLLAWRRLRARRPRLGPAAAVLAALLAAGTVRADVLDYAAPYGNFYGDQPGVLDVHHRATHLGSPVDGLQWWAAGYDDLSGVAWSALNSPGTLAHVDLRVLNGQPLRLDGFRLGSWAGAEGKLETVSVTRIGDDTPAWQFTGLIGVGNVANTFGVGLQSDTGFTITWTNPWWTAIDDIRFQTSAVPEPGAAALWLTGLPALMAWVRRRRR